MPSVCLDDQRAQAFAAATLSEPARLEIEDHVDDCASCRKLLAALVRAEPAPRTSRWSAGDRIGRYRIGARIGRGGMGEVFRGEDVELARPVALKRLRAEDGGTAAGRAQLVREARAAAQLQHPNVVAVYEIVDGELDTFLAMEWIDGMTLREWLRERPRTWREIVQMVVAAGRGLAAAHASGILHRDFKPENVLVDRSGRPRVADFGLARPLATPHDTMHDTNGTPQRGPVHALGTATGSLAGTPAYLAPELNGAEQRAPDPRSDQYAFAITLFEALHGIHPFAGDTPVTIWLEMAEGRIRRGQARIPAWLDRAVRRGLATDPAQRWPDLAALLGELEARSRRVTRGTVLVAAAIGATVVAGVWLLAPAPAHDVCGDQLVDAVWSPIARATYAGQFAAAAPGRSAATLASTDLLLDHWTGAWRLHRRAACTAEPGQRTARSSCLDRQLGELRAQLAVWTRADAGVVDHAAAAIAALPDPEACADAHAPPLPASPAFIEAAANYDALQRSGRWQEALANTPALLAQTELVADPAAKASALLAIATVELDAHARGPARTHAIAAAHAASLARDDRRLAAALLLEAATLIDEHRPADALGVCDAVEAIAARGLPRAEKVDLVRAHALRQLGKLDESITHFRRAIGRLESAAARDPARRLELASAIGALGATLGMNQQPAEGAVELRRALAIEEPALGPNHPEVGRTLHDLGFQERELGQLDAAERSFTRTRTILVAAFGEASLEVASTDAALADVAFARGDLDRLQLLAQRARDELARAGLDEPALLSLLESQLGTALQDRDRCAEAIPHYELALSLSVRAKEAPDQQALAYVNLASCLSDVGRDAAGRTAAEQALAAWATAGLETPLRAQAWAILADLEARGGRRKQAIEIADKALAAISGLEDDAFTAMRDHLTDQLAIWSAGR